MVWRFSAATRSIASFSMGLQHEGGVLVAASRRADFPTEIERLLLQAKRLGATDQIGHRAYLAALLPHMNACTDPDFEVEFKTMTPSVNRAWAKLAGSWASGP